MMVRGDNMIEAVSPMRQTMDRYQSQVVSELLREGRKSYACFIVFQRMVRCSLTCRPVRSQCLSADRARVRLAALLGEGSPQA
jgi:hypothetical protein